MHCSGESASQVGEFINNFQFVSIHNDGLFIVRFSRCWLVLLRHEIGLYCGRGAQRQPHSLVRTQLCTEARHRSRRLVLDLDAVDDRNILGALSRSACSTTCCCIAFRTIESEDFFRFIYRNSICISGLGISRHTGFILQ